MTIGSIFGKSFEKSFVWSKCVNDRNIIMKFLIKYNYGVFDEMSIIELVIK